MDPVPADLRLLLAAERLYSRDDVLTRPSPVPRQAGVYAWYFDEAPPGVPVEGCHVLASQVLLYVGVSPSRPGSKGTLYARLRTHFRDNASRSTLRRTLGSLLAESLDLRPRRVGRTARLTFSDGERLLSEWMARHTRVCWLPRESPWLLERELTGHLSLPLNLEGNLLHPFYPTLHQARRMQAATARSLPVLPR